MMNIRSQAKALLLAILLSAVLAACLGEPALPIVGPDGNVVLQPPAVDPTAAAAPRLSLGLERQPASAGEEIPRVPHDLIGRSDCLMCHKQGVGGSPRIPDAHRGLESATCLTCHTAPVSAELSAEELYARICARCHGDQGQGGKGPALRVKSYLQSVSDSDLRAAIERGRGAVEMLAWGDLGLLGENQIDRLVRMLRSWEADAPLSSQVQVQPIQAQLGDAQQGELIFSQFCSGCHGLDGESPLKTGRTLRQESADLTDEQVARYIRDGAEGMPAFHALLSSDEINHLLALLRTWHAGPQATATPVLLSGSEIFTRVCARCHGANGEGGVGLPLNSKEFLAANDDRAIRQWIVRGTQGTSMLSWGDLGLLQPKQINELVAFIRAWEATAPSTADRLPAAVTASAAQGQADHGQQLFAQFCSGCHGLEGERQTAGIRLNSPAYLDSSPDGMIASQILDGGRAMPSFHSILTGQDVNDLLAYMRAGFKAGSISPSNVSFAADVMPILKSQCLVCHGSAGGWSAASYDQAVNSGQHGAAVIPGNPDRSILIQKLRGTQSFGGIMPPARALTSAEIELIASWIAAGAPNN